jgi:hypothetical protein
MKRRLLDRFNDQAFEALSAVRYGPVRRIGFLDAAKSCVGGSSPAAARLIGGSV